MSREAIGSERGTQRRAIAVELAVEAGKTIRKVKNLLKCIFRSPLGGTKGEEQTFISTSAAPSASFVGRKIDTFFLFLTLRQLASLQPQCQGGSAVIKRSPELLNYQLRRFTWPCG